MGSLRMRARRSEVCANELGSQGLPLGLVIGDQRTVGLHDWRPEREVHVPRVNSGGWHPRTAFCVPPGYNSSCIFNAYFDRAVETLR